MKSHASRLCYEALEEFFTVKKIEAIIRHFKLEEVTQALLALEIPGMTVTDVRGNVPRHGVNSCCGSAEFLPKVVLEMVVSAEQVRPAVDTIQRIARTDQSGDGRILISDLTQVVRIRTGEICDTPLAASA